MKYGKSGDFQATVVPLSGEVASSMTLAVRFFFYQEEEMTNNGDNKGEFRTLTPQEIGQTVLLFRKLIGCKQLALALDANIHERTVQRIERGEKVDEDTLRKIARTLRLDEESF